MKNKTEVSRTDVCVRVVKGALEAGGGVLGEKVAPPQPSPHHPSSPPLSPAIISSTTPPSQTKIKCESPTVYLNTHTPPPSIPGAEVKGKPGNAIASGSSRVVALPLGAGEEGKAGVTAATGGGRLTFFKEGKFLLELSHRSDTGAPTGWVPVKSKTYWPPPSSATTTTTQHPLRHDTPTSQSVSDDCSSLNSSPWTNDHVRKQSLPHPTRGSSTLQVLCFFWCCSPEARSFRRQLPVRRRNPYLPRPWVEGLKLEGIVKPLRWKAKVEGESAKERKARLEKWVRLLSLKLGVKLEAEVTIQGLFEKPQGVVGAAVGAGEGVDPTFISPRKRYLRQMETDQDSSSLNRKKIHSGLNSIPVERGGAYTPSNSSSSSTSSSSSLSSSSSSTTTSSQPLPQSNRSAINSLTSSVYSIDSILNHEGASRRGDSFLRNLLKPEARPSPARPRERPADPPLAPAKPERVERPERDRDRTEQLGSSQERMDSLLDLNRLSSERYDLSRYSQVASLYNLSPYLDPRYMLMQSLAPGLVSPVTPQHTEVAQALAAAAAAAAAGLGTYPLGPLHPSLPGAQYPHLLPAGYPPPTQQLLRPQAHTSRSSPHSAAAASPTAPASPHLSSRGGASPWPPPPPAAHRLSSPPSLTSPLPSPPPQDVPLNLSKPRNHLGK